jgi:hypothetical protein
MFLAFPLQSMAQFGNCDSLQIIDVELNPFQNDEILVRSSYTDFDQFISYPGFILVDEMQTTLAFETVDFFGMSPQQVHVLDVLGLTITEGTAVDANLELWSFFYEYLECTLNGPFVLWPEQNCVPLKLSFNALGENPLTGILNWSVNTEAGTVAESGVLELNPDTLSAELEFCLEHGCNYELNIVLEGAAEGNWVSFALHYKEFLSVGAEGLLSAELPGFSENFNIYNCLTTGTNELRNTSPVLYPNPAINSFSLRFSDRTGPMTVHAADLTGRVLFSESLDAQNNEVIVDCSGWSPGIYLISTMDQTGNKLVQRAVVSR